MQNRPSVGSSNNYVDARKKSAFLMFNKIAKTYDTINSLLSMGIDIYWRRQLLKKIPNKPRLKVLDLATGTGKIALKLSRRKNLSGITAVDLSGEMIQVAIKRYQKMKSSRRQKKRLVPINFIVTDGVKFNDKKNWYDIVTIGFGIRNMYDPEETLLNIHKMLRNEGKILVLELSIPQNSFFKKSFLCYFRHILPKIGGFISNNVEAYTYLNETVEIFPSGENFVALLESCGFSDVKTYPLTFGTANLYEGVKKIEEQTGDKNKLP